LREKLFVIVKTLTVLGKPSDSQALKPQFSVNMQHRRLIQ
jgi:hypothetical protein